MIKKPHNGEYACYLLGIINKKPEEIVYLTNGKAHEIEVCGYSIKIIRTKIPTPKKKGDKPTLATQALLYLGEDKINEEILNKIISQLNDKELKKFKKLKNIMPKRMINFLYRKSIMFA